MTTESRPVSPTRPFTAAVLLATLVAIGIGLLAPLLFGSFSERQALILVGIEAICLVAVTGGVLAMAHRVRTSHEALWELALRDELTGVGNYRALHERLEEEIARHHRHRREFALILIDLDGFKQVNERYGHLDGDRLLSEVGAALSDEIRREDSVFRQGGDEFAVIVPEASAEEAGEFAVRLRRRVSNRRFGSDERFAVSAATGFAMYPADGTTEQQLFSRADHDLFAAKRAAR